jgi:hypothetical protein
LVEEVLDELFFEGAGGEEAVQVGAEELGDEVAGTVVRVVFVRLGEGRWTYMSSSGDMKMSLREMT